MQSFFWGIFTGCAIIFFAPRIVIEALILIIGLILQIKILFELILSLKKNRPNREI